MKQFLILLCAVTLLAHTSVAQKKSTSNKKGKTAVPVETVNPQKGFVVIETSLGNITIQLNDAAAPKHSANFRKLAKEGFLK